MLCIYIYFFVYIYNLYIYIYYTYIYFVCLNMKMSNKNIFKKTFFKKTSYISVCSKTLRLCIIYVHLPSPRKCPIKQ